MNNECATRPEIALDGACWRRHGRGFLQAHRCASSLDRRWSGVQKSQANGGTAAGFVTPPGTNKEWLTNKQAMKHDRTIVGLSVVDQTSWWKPWSAAAPGYFSYPPGSPMSVAIHRWTSTKRVPEEVCACFKAFLCNLWFQTFGSDPASPFSAAHPCAPVVLTSRRTSPTSS